MKWLESLKNIVSRKSWYGLIEPRSSGMEGYGTFTGKNLLSAYDISLYTNKCISKRADKVSQVEFVLKDRKTDKPIEKHPILDLLNKPNNIFDGVEFWRLYQIYRDLTGEAYILIVSDRELFSKNKIPTSLHLLNPYLVRPEEWNDERGRFEKYVYQLPGGGQKPYSADEVIRLYNPDPKQQLKAISLLTSGIQAIKTESQLAEYQASVLKNGGRLEGIFKFKLPTLSKKQLQENKDGYEKQYAEAQKSGKPIFLGGDVDYQHIALNPAELAFLESKKATLNDICLLTGVPKALLANLDDIKYSNADASIRIFLREVIKPLLRNLTSKLDEFLVPKEYVLDFIDPTPEDKEMKFKELETANGIYAMTINEKREQLGLDPIPDGDKILIPFNLVGLGEDQGGGQKKIKGFMHPLQNKAVRERYAKNYERKLESREKKFAIEMKRYFRRQKDEIIDKLKEVKSVKNLIDDIFNPKLEIAIAIKKFKPLLQKELIEAGLDAIEFVGSDADFNLSGEIESWLDKRTNVFSTSINDTTFKKLQSEFKDSLAENENRQQLIRRIEEVYGNFDKHRAENIAKTEIHGAIQKGTFEGYKQVNTPIKIWVAVGDSHTRPSHMSIDGEEKPIDMPFSNGLMHPGDPNGSSAETVGCRCTI